MRKKAPLFGACVALGVVAILAGCLAWEIFSLFTVTRTEVPAAESRIWLEQDHAGRGKTEITDPEDVAFLRQLFGHPYEAVFDDPICPFDAVKISFEHKGRAIRFHPATDDCEFVRYGNTQKTFAIMPEEKERLKELLEKYWITG